MGEVQSFGVEGILCATDCIRDTCHFMSIMRAALLQFSIFVRIHSNLFDRIKLKDKFSMYNTKQLISPSPFLNPHLI